MKVATVFEEGARLYSTPSVQFIGRELVIWRLNDEDHRLIANLGPHFGLIQPHVPLDRDNLECRFKAEGARCIGSVSYLSGAWARDGTDDYDIARIDAMYQHTSSGLKMLIALEVGDQIKDGAAHVRAKRKAISYVLEVAVPFSDYLQFWGITDPIARTWQRDKIEKIFGQASAKALNA